MDRLIESRKREAENLGLSRMGLRRTDAKKDSDALRIEEAVEEEESHIDGATAYLDGLSTLAWTRFIQAVAREMNRRIEIRRQGQIARRRMLRRTQSA